jgi:ubiquinone/menaquinone biosynthesis C-methylase UbiE
MPDPIMVNKELLEQTFDEVATSYNRTWYFKECGQSLIDLLPISPGANVLDIATGTGMVLLPAAKRVGFKGHVTGIDISGVMLQQAKQAATENGLRNIDLLKMDAEHLEFPDASFDVITSGFGIFFFPPAALREMYRVCKLGGVIGVTVFDKTVPESRRAMQIFNELAKEYGIEFKFSWPTSFAPEEVELLLGKYGFQSKQTLRETKEKVYANTEEYWEVILSTANRMFVMNMNKGTLAGFKDEYLKRLKSIVRPDGLHNLVPVIYAVAQK